MFCLLKIEAYLSVIKSILHQFIGEFWFERVEKTNIHHQNQM